MIHKTEITSKDVADFLKEMGGDVRSSFWSSRFSSPLPTEMLEYLEDIGIVKWERTGRRGPPSRVLCVTLEEALQRIRQNPRIFQCGKKKPRRPDAIQGDYTRDAWPFWDLFCAILKRAKMDIENRIHVDDDDLRTSPSEAEAWLRNYGAPIAGQVVEGGDGIITEWLDAQSA